MGPSHKVGVVIVGAGHAGYQTAESLRREGYKEPIVLIGDEPYAPYHRPPLSKAYLLGETDKERLKFRTIDYYLEHGIDLWLSVSVSAIDRTARRVVLGDGKHIPYDDLVLATGARVRKLTVAGSDLKGVYYLKTLSDIESIEARLEFAKNIVIIGGGFIGLEFAAVAQKLKKTVTILEVSPRILGRVVSPELSLFFSSLHESQGTKVICDIEVVEIVGNGETVSAVIGGDCREYKADIVLIGIGVTPNIELAATAELACKKGIIVDEHSQTEDAHIYAAGDCTSYLHPFVGKPVRLESVQNANDQGRSAAAAIANNPKPYVTIPWFWSIQYDVKLQLVGLREGCDETVQSGKMAANNFSLFHFRNRQLRAVESVNRPIDHIQTRKILAAGISPSPEEVADENFSLKNFIV